MIELIEYQIWMIKNATLTIRSYFFPYLFVIGEVFIFLILQIIERHIYNRIEEDKRKVLYDNNGRIRS